MSSQTCVPTGPPDPGVQPTSPLLGLQGLLLVPGLVPRGWGIDVSHRWWCYLCHRLLCSWLLVRSSSLCFSPLGPSVLKPNLSPQRKTHPTESESQTRGGNQNPSPNAWTLGQALTAHLATDAQSYSFPLPRYQPKQCSLNCSCGPTDGSEGQCRRYDMHFK